MLYKYIYYLYNFRDKWHEKIQQSKEIKTGMGVAVTGTILSRMNSKDSLR